MLQSSNPNCSVHVTLALGLAANAMFTSVGDGTARFVGLTFDHPPFPSDWVMLCEATSALVYFGFSRNLTDLFVDIGFTCRFIFKVRINQCTVSK